MIRIRAIATAASVAALLLSASDASSQTIVGTVRGAGIGIVGATVRLLELDRVLRSGAEGRFAFSDVPAGTYRVFVSATGFASSTDTVSLTGARATANFDLQLSAVPLKEVVVSASPVTRTTDEQLRPSATKTQVDLLNSPGASFAEKISDLPGVTVRGNGSAPSRPILRGLGDNEVVILENGLRIGDIATYDPAHATPISTLGITQVDVVRGPATIMYGPSTIGGVVNVMTDLVPTIADRPLSGTAAVEGNSVSDEASGYFNNVYSGDNQAFRVSGGLVRSHDIRIPSGTYTDPASGASFNLDRMPQTFERSGEFGTGYAYQGNFGMIGIGAKRFELNYGIPGVPPNPDFIDVPPTTSRITQERSAFELRSLFNVGNAFAKQIKVNASYNDYTHSEFPTAQDSTGVSDPQANHFHKREFNGVFQLQQKPMGKLQGTLGLWTNIENLTIEGDAPLGPNSLTTGLAGYAYEEYVASPSTRLEIGLRYDYNKIQTNPYPGSTDSVFRTIDVSRLSNALTASVGVVQQLTSRVTSSFSVARSFRAPTVQELFANGVDAASGTYSIGTAGLGPETGLGVDASLKGTFNKVTFEASPFVNYINGYLYGFLRGDTIQDFPVRQFAATDARLMGFEANVTVRPVDRFALEGSSDYVNAEDTNRNVPLPFIPPLRGRLRGTYQDETYMGMIEWRLAASQTRLGDGDTPTSGYTVLNVAVGLRFVHSSMVDNISLHCDNVFNAVYRDNLSVIKDFLPQPGRGFRINYALLY